MKDEGIQTDGSPLLGLLRGRSEASNVSNSCAFRNPVSPDCPLPAAFLNAFELALESTTTAALRHSLEAASIPTPVSIIKVVGRIDRASLYPRRG